MRQVFHAQGVKGVVIACPDCGENHYYEWELLKDNLEHMLHTGEPRMHEPAWEIARTSTSSGTTARATSTRSPTPASSPRRSRSPCPWCETPCEDLFRFCPRCGRALAAVRLFQDLTDRGLDEREARAILVRAGYEPF